MKLSISNIAWTSDSDTAMYEMMRDLGFSGLEIAPTRIFPAAPYEHIEEASAWSKDLRKRYGFVISSMQSIWFGRTERIFAGEEDRRKLYNYTKLAVDFAHTIGCGNLVFGCPHNRIVREGEDTSSAVEFFHELGEYALEKGTILAIEPNPAVYNTNYINDTVSALELIRQVNSKGFRLNLDLGAMIANEEDLSVLYGNEAFISHVHISEPGLKPLERRQLHAELADFLRASGYQRFISIEVSRRDSAEQPSEMMQYIRNIFG